MRTFILLHRIKGQLQPNQVGMQFNQEPDLYYVDDISGIQRAIINGYDGILIKGVGTIVVKESAKVIIEMITAAS